MDHQNTKILAVKREKKKHSRGGKNNRWSSPAFSCYESKYIHNQEGEESSIDFRIALLLPLTASATPEHAWAGGPVNVLLSPLIQLCACAVRGPWRLHLGAIQRFCWAAWIVVTAPAGWEGGRRKWAACQWTDQLGRESCHTVAPDFSFTDSCWGVHRTGIQNARIAECECWAWFEPFCRCAR